MQSLKYIYTLLKYTARSGALGVLSGATLPMAPSDDLHVEGQSVSETKPISVKGKLHFLVFFFSPGNFRKHFNAPSVAPGI